MKNTTTIQRKNLDQSRVRLTIPITNAVFKVAFERELTAIAKDVKVEGFRPGKAPLTKVLAQIGRQRVEAGALDRAINTAYIDALQSEALMPVANPDVEVTNYTAPAEDAADTDVVGSFTAEVDVLPEVSVKGYEKIKVKAPKAVEVTDKDVQEVVDYLRKQQASLKELADDVEAKKGMWADIGFAGSIDGVARENMKSEHHPLVLGEGQLIPGFEDNVIGMKKGEEKTFKITFPKDYHAKDIAGKQAEFTATLHELKDVVMPVVDKGFATKFGHDTVDKLETAVKENLVLEREQEKQLKLEELVIDELLKLTKFTVPRSLVHQEEHRLHDETMRRAGGMPLRPELEEQIKVQAEKNVKIGVALGKVIELEKIEEKEQAMRHALDKLIAIATR